MFNATITGPDYQTMHTSFQYECVVSGIPPEMEGQTYSVLYQWQKNETDITGADQSVRNLYDAEAPAAGNFRCVASLRPETGEDILAYSNTITLEMGNEERELTLEVDGLTDPVYCKFGHTVTVDPTIQTDAATVETVWSKDGDEVATTKSLTIPEAAPDLMGVYQYSVNASSPGSYKPVSRMFNVMLAMEEPEITCEPIYIHDLRPARDHGFLWIGYWVTDEIKQAVADGFDWMANPMDDRFKYKCQIANLVRGFNEWEDLEIMESRNGYILGRKDLT